MVQSYYFIAISKDPFLGTDGTLLAATSNGDPKSQVRLFSLVPEILEFDEKFSLNLKVETFPGLFLQSTTMPPAKGLKSFVS